MQRAPEGHGASSAGRESVLRRDSFRDYGTSAGGDGGSATEHMSVACPSSAQMSFCAHTPSQAQWAPPGFDRSEAAFDLNAPYAPPGGGEPAELTPTVVLASVLAGLVSVLDNAPYGLVLFPGAFQAQYSAVGVTMVLTAAGLAQVSMAFTSAFRTGCGCMVVENLPFLAMMGRDVSDTLVQQGLEDRVVPTLVLLWAVSSVLSGLAMYALGATHAGKLTAYFPRHVLLGYVGGMGIFILLAGIEITSNRKWGWGADALMGLMERGVACRLAVTFVLWAFIPVGRAPAVMPIYLLSIPVVFWSVVWYFGLEDAARENEWVITTGGESGIQGILPLTLINPWKVAWHVLHSQIFSIAGIVIFTALHVPVNVPALAMTVGQSCDIDREFKAHGISNMLSGALGGLQTYLVYSTSALYYKCGGSGRVGQLVVAAVIFVFAVGGRVALELLPRPLAGVVLIHLGSELLKEVFVDSLVTITPVEYAQVVVVVASMEAFGFMQGLGIGLLLACAAFIFASSSEDPIDFSSPGGGLRSVIVRPLQLRRRLDQLQDRCVWVLRLNSSSLFFGNSVRVLEHAEGVMESHPELRFLVLHLVKLKGSDCTAVQALADLVTVASRRQVTVVFAALPADLRRRVTHAVKESDARSMHCSDDINGAFTWVEEALLVSVAPPQQPPGAGVFGLLRMLAPDVPKASLHDLAVSFKKQTLAAGDVLWRRGDEPSYAVVLSEGLLGVVTGDATAASAAAAAAAECGGGGGVAYAEYRRPHSMAGELGLLTGERRQHMLVALSPSVVWAVTLDGLKASPDRLMCFNQIALSCASHRLHQLTLLGQVHTV
eukprot:Rhum_TRINITY_DN13384_c0_g2::Rhum_TRINITY_DN13384_c0_g2_i1::g.59625::m.59625/K03321/TC.SULP; sulfate permease, SulP family